MGTAKLHLKIGNIEFVCEGEEAWVGAQLDKVLLRLSEQRITNQQNSLPGGVKLNIVNKNVSDYPCDVLILKYAQEFYGADHKISQILAEYGIDLEEMRVEPNEFRLFSSNGAIAAQQVLFLGVNTLHQFRYDEIRDFSEKALSIISQEAPDAMHIAMTIHGVGYGLNEQRAFVSQITGLLAAIRKQTISSNLKQVTIVERDQARTTRLKRILNEYLANK